MSYAFNKDHFTDAFDVHAPPEWDISAFNDDFNTDFKTEAIPRERLSAGDYYIVHAGGC